MNFAKEIAGLPGLMKTSAEQLRKVPALTGTAMLTALNVVVGTLFIPITPTLRIGFSSIPAAVCGMYYGPICTGFAGVIADTLKYIIRPDGPYFPGFAVNEFLTGMIYGCFFYKKNHPSQSDHCQSLHHCIYQSDSDISMAEHDVPESALYHDAAD